MDGLTFEQLAQRNAERLPLWHPSNSIEWSLADWSNAMQGEAGECGNIIKKLRRIETFTDRGPWSHELHTTKREIPHDRNTELRILAKGAGLEIADTVIYCDLLAQELHRKYGGYSMAELVSTKFNAISHRMNFDIWLP